jgi:hypothetical protein
VTAHFSLHQCTDKGSAWLSADSVREGCAQGAAAIWGLTLKLAGGPGPLARIRRMQVLGRHRLPRRAPRVQGTGGGMGPEHAAMVKTSQASVLDNALRCHHDPLQQPSNITQPRDEAPEPSAGRILFTRRSGRKRTCRCNEGLGTGFCLRDRDQFTACAVSWSRGKTAAGALRFLAQPHPGAECCGTDRAIARWLRVATVSADDARTYQAPDDSRSSAPNAGHCRTGRDRGQDGAA